MTPSPQRPELPEEDRRVLRAWMVSFERGWKDDRLDKRARDLPPEDNPLRRPLLLGMIDIDLPRQWEAGHRLTLESYLERFPELGSAADAPTELVHAEYKARLLHDTPRGVNAFLRRFPRQVEEMRKRLEEQAEDASDLTYSGLVESGTLAGSQTPAVDREPPDRLGPYQVLQPLGQGGMGRVYLARDARVGRLVALKIPRFRPDEDRKMIERFYRAARAATAFRHPGLCPVYETGEIDGFHYLTMAYVPGEPLSQWFKAAKPLPQRDAADCVRRLAWTLAEAHSQGVVHRDLKPSNVMRQTDGTLVVMDFGLARRVNSFDPRLTKQGDLMGTPAYMSPEQVAADPQALGPNCDIYSLGVILYELLTGEVPFKGFIGLVLSSISSEEPEPPTAKRPDIDPALERICLKAMAKRVEDRYVTMPDFAAALDDYLRPPDPVKPEMTPAPAPEAKLKAPAAPTWRGNATEKPVPLKGWQVLAVVGLVLLALGFVVLFRPPPPGSVRFEFSGPTHGLNISIDGQPYRVSDLISSIPLPAGEHELVANGESIQPIRLSFKVLAGEELQLPIRFLPRKIGASVP